MSCRACQIERAKAARENPNSFCHGVCCESCLVARTEQQLNDMRIYWKELKAKLNACDRSTRSGASLAKDLENRLEHIVKNAQQLKEGLK